LDFLQHHIESLIFCSPDPIKPEDIRTCLSEMFEAEVPIEDIQASLEKLLQKYEDDNYPFKVFSMGGGYQFLTKPAYQSSISILLKQKSKKRLSTSALETCAIIAYKQPITKHQIEQIRGVNCDYAIQKLLEKELVEIQGKSDGVGRPILYGTTAKFMEYFGINSLKDLPMPKDFSKDENEIGDEVEKEHEIIAAELEEMEFNTQDNNNSTEIQNKENETQDTFGDLSSQTNSQSEEDFSSESQNPVEPEE
jgi:segregation and condensation protein B